MASKLHARQRGVALLMILLVLVVSGSAFVISAANSRTPELRQQADIREEMALAKEALLAYAMQYADLYWTDSDSDGINDAPGPGRLPCPDTDNDGLPEAGCSTSQPTLGRLPERLSPALGVNFSFSSSFAGLDRQFWYAVAPEFNTASAVVNSTTDGSLTLDGESDIVAVLIAPGAALSGQVRPSIEAPNYLEGGNADGDGNFVGYADPDGFNDVALAITRQELMTLVVHKVIQPVREQLDAYYVDAYPDYSQTQARIFNFYFYWNGIQYCSVDYVTAYPQDDTLVNPSYCTPQHDAPERFIFAMQDAPDWFFDDGWDGVTTYTRDANTEADIAFDECGIGFTVEYNDGITRDQTTC